MGNSLSECPFDSLGGSIHETMVLQADDEVFDVETAARSVAQCSDKFQYVTKRI